ncbi:hypothetical protein RJ640_029760 [Escallonia rubra]|uniref:Transposase (putative) gypsy type domain-containing protein n=1 Tax=Escallonia rubra TaxID=112253 RepID=A0AA88U1X2_9ASTE|nr:hypothetical protein RJ640_029760 [Escallonia rubra]
MSKEELEPLILECPLPEGWYARVLELQELANYGTDWETGMYEEQVRSGYRRFLHPFDLKLFKHYHMAPGQLVPNGWRKLAGLIYLIETSGYKADSTDFMRVFFEICFVKGVASCPRWYYIHSRQRLLKRGPKSNKGWHSRYFFAGLENKGELPFDKTCNAYCKDFENMGKPVPNNITKHILSHIKLRGGLSIDEPLSEQQLEYRKIIHCKPIPADLSVLPPPPTLPSTSSTETTTLEIASGSRKSPQGGFINVLQKAKRKRKEKHPSVEMPRNPKRTKVSLPEHSPRIVEGVSIVEDPIFWPRWTIRREDMGMPNSQISEQHLLHGVLPKDKELLMYAYMAEMLSRFEMERDVAAVEAQEKRDAVKQAAKATLRAEELSKREANHLAQTKALERRLERAKKDS